VNHVIANGVKQSRHNRLTSMEIYFSLSMYQAEIGSSILDELGNCHSLSENERKYSVNPVSLRGMKSRSNLEFRGIAEPVPSLHRDCFVVPKAFGTPLMTEKCLART